MVAIYTLLVFIGSQSPFKVLQHGGQTARGPHPRPQRYLHSLGHFCWAWRMQSDLELPGVTRVNLWWNEAETHGILVGGCFPTQVETYA